ncbi:Uncharacterised protein [uncultured archaeon]|nr:Uncharacterised protein [uncultured archaeon]
MAPTKTESTVASKKKVKYTATITSCADDGTNYYISISVDIGGSYLGYTVTVPISTFSTTNECSSWLSDWITENKASFEDNSQNGLFVGVSATS